MVAVETLSAGWQAVLFGVATALFLVAALTPAYRAKADRVRSIDLVALGLAFATFVFFFNALAGA